MSTIGIWIAVFLTLAIYSFLYKDNPFYKLAEHIYVGFSAAYWVIYVWFFDIKPMLIDKFNSSQGIDKWILIIPAIFSILMLTRFIPRISWLSRWAIAFTVGIGAGLGITGGIQGFIIPQVRASFLPLNSINNIILVIGFLTTLIYFYFSREQKGVIKGFARIGITFIMISFGASFGYTVMARLSLLIGRIHFLLHDWLHLIK